MYREPLIQLPGLEDMQHIANSLHLGIPREDIPVYRGKYMPETF
jgi:hypothetical protein